LVVGKKETAGRTVSIRRLGSQEQTEMSLDAALTLLAEDATPPDLRRAQSRP
jgi:threonyl-tRNA synthetase